MGKIKSFLAITILVNLSLNFLIKMGSSRKRRVLLVSNLKSIMGNMHSDFRVERVRCSLFNI